MATNSNIIVFDNFTFGFEKNIIYVYSQGEKIGSVCQNQRSLLWTCECHLSESHFNQAKQWIKYCKNTCDYESFGNRPIHCRQCLVSKELEKILLSDPKMDKQNFTIYWTCYSVGGLTSALSQLRDFWISLNHSA
ncbi:hypothetical protein [Acanthamoeba polyphaga mimivirus]|uniref:Uncharacterized protein n=3 Tax=Megamimivirinae TaxID=3044648 RepID=A0A2L2DKS9_MIMIV|nr:hypothetical protein MegaChil _gp1031 [Megavirus chiliensis]AEQ33303.1 hypothetical protein [Megavirus chiliensis]AGD92999.1 hypothetical protein LBA_01081 [Megavirus lba]AVG46747.1 hypothetical protein [Acanthamoeba polyphaga mimivirus]AVG47868.1 hypothetical protein [Acanthamoeba polyphaga mimivirus]